MKKAVCLKKCKTQIDKLYNLQKIQTQNFAFQTQSLLMKESFVPAHKDFLSCLGPQYYEKYFYERLNAGRNLTLNYDL